MRTTITVISCIALFGAGSVQAAEASKEEKIGVGSGALVGVIAGGPVGLVIGATVGAKLGDTLHRKNETIEQLDVSLMQSRSDLQKMKTNYAAVSDELDHIQTLARPELVDMLQAGIAMDLLFRTDEASLADTTGDRLAKLGRTVAAMPDVRVQLDGFADERGDESYNLQLSEQRVEFVRKQLESAGIHPSRIRASAHGESVAQDDSVDSYALERRVSLKLYIDSSQPVAQVTE